MKGKDFLEHSENIDLPDIPRTLAWCDQTVIIGCKNEYFLFDASLLIVNINITKKKQCYILEHEANNKNI